LSVSERARAEFANTVLAAAGADKPSNFAGWGAPALLEPLSDREKEIHTLLLQGLKNREIAKALHISENTVKFHLKNLFAKLGVTNRFKAISIGGADTLVDNAGK
ncbi:MAG: helix-turn-helix transcriptional regulator, partial [Alphaproteobacteria bacterium]|nr:helix-turn-helix transcriptional regulator [Alphaproteobacteria bacterium]